MDKDFQFYIIKGRITDSSANPLEDISVFLRRADSLHETEVLISDRTNSRGEFYFEESLRIGERMRIEVDDFSNRYSRDNREFTTTSNDVVTINFVL